MADPRAVFSVMGPDLPIEEISVGTETFTIGRLAENNLALNHAKVSRHHADITYNGNFYAVEDLESSNGTYINDARIDAKKKVPLEVGDVIRFGPFALTLLRIEQATEAAPPTPPEPAAKPAKAKADEAAPSPIPDTEPPAAAEKAVHRSEPPPEPAEAATAQPKQTVAKQPKSPKGEGKTNGKLSDEMDLAIRPPIPPSTNGHHAPLEPYIPIEGVSLTESRYVQYLPGIYSDSDFLKRYLLIMESILAPHEWGIDSFEQFYNPLLTTPDWLQWIGEWFDILIHPEIPVERQRAVIKELGMLFRRRGTRYGLERLLQLYFDVTPVITEHDTPPSTFTVKLPLGKADSPLYRSLASQLISTFKPAHTGFTLEIT